MEKKIPLEDHRSSASYLLKTLFLIDGLSDDPLKNVDILVENGVITKIGTQLQSNTANVIDLTEYTVLPGFIDAHCHPCIFKDDYQIQHLKYSSAYKALKGLKSVQEMLFNGWTSIRICGDADVFYAPLDIKQAIEDRLHKGPRIAAAGHYLSITGGGGDINQISAEHCCHSDGRIVDGVEEMRKAVREEIKYGSDWIKILVTGAFMSQRDDPRMVHFSSEELQVCVSEANRLGRHVAAHAHSAEGIKQAIKAGARSIEHGSFVDDEGIAMMVERGTYLVPTIFIGEYYLTENQSEAFNKAKELKKHYNDLFMDCIRKAHKAGVKIVVGTDYCDWDVNLNVGEFKCLLDIGMTPMQAIKAGTSVAASMLQWDTKVGSIKEGMLADIVAVKGNPLEDMTALRNVQFVMLGGQIMKQ